MANFVLLALCFGLGLLARRFSGLPDDAPKVINVWVVWVALPALVLRTVRTVTFEGQMLLGAAGLWLIFAVAAIIALIAVRQKRVSTQTAGALLLCSALGNTVFVGLPLIEALAGHEAMATAAVIDQLGTFLALSILAVPMATWLSGQQPSLKAVALRVLKFPPFLALMTALMLRGLPFPEFVETVLGRLADTLTPLTLVALGFQWSLGALAGHGRSLAVGLTYKLFVAPLMMLGLMVAVEHAVNRVAVLSVLQASMAPMITAGVLTQEFELNPRLATALISIGIPLSFITVPLWYYLLGAHS